VGIVTRLRAGWSGFRIPIAQRDFSPVQNVQTDSGAHPASCLIATEVLPREIKRSGHKINLLPPSSAEVTNRWSYTSTAPLTDTLYIHISNATQQCNECTASLYTFINAGLLISLPKSRVSFFKVRTQRSIEFFIIVDPVYPTSALTVTGLAMGYCIIKSSTKVTDQGETTTEASNCDV